MHDPELQTFAERLLLHRKRRGMSQDALSDAIGVAQDTISKWERGRASAPVGELIKLCALFGVSADYLIGRVDGEHGLPVGMFLVDLDAIEDPREGETWAQQIPQRPALMSYDQVKAIHKAGASSVRKGKR